MIQHEFRYGIDVGSQGWISPSVEKRQELFGPSYLKDVKDRLEAMYSARTERHEAMDDVLVPSSGDPASLTSDYMALSSRWPIRFQGNRPTCTAFAAVACCEQLLVAENNLHELSQESCYQHSRLGQFVPACMTDEEFELGGAKLIQAKRVIDDIGLSLENAAPYSSSVPTPNEITTTLKVPISSFRFEPAFYWDKIPCSDDVGEVSQLLDDSPSSTVYSELVAGRACAVGFPMFMHKTRNDRSNWINGDTWSTGKVFGPGDEKFSKQFSSEPSDIGHVVCIVGYQKISETSGFFVFRNSWGPNKHGYNFAETAYYDESVRPSVPGTGYGIVSDLHLDAFGWEILSLKLK